MERYAKGCFEGHWAVSGWMDGSFRWQHVPFGENALAVLFIRLRHQIPQIICGVQTFHPHEVRWSAIPLPNPMAQLENLLKEKFVRPRGKILEVFGDFQTL